MRPESLNCSIRSPKLAAGLRVETGGGLVDEKQIGIVNKRAGQCQALLLAAGEMADAGILFFFELHECEGFGRARPLLKKAAEQA